ncbi:MAG: DMT family transporter, partial [Candidatus Aminicenantes bacterium]|nr:DMT family transporter [Candidatus Aminicenantes bacterium]
MKIRSVIYLICFALFVAMGHILQKIVLNHGVDKVVFAFLRITAGFAIISVILFYKKYDPVKIVKKNYKHFLVLGIGFSGLGIILKLWGLQNTTAVNASFIMSLSSAAAVLFAFLFLKEIPSKRFYIFMAIMIFGV